MSDTRKKINDSVPTEVTKSINNAKMRNILSQKINDEDRKDQSESSIDSDEEYERFCEELQSESVKAWEKVLRITKDSDVTAVMAKYRSDPMQALDLTEQDIYKILALDERFYNETFRSRMAHMVKADLVNRKAFVEKNKSKKAEAEKEAKKRKEEKEQAEKVLAHLKDKVTIRLDHFIEDLHKFEILLSRLNFDGSLLLSLLLQSVERALLNKTRELIESGQLDGLTWKRCKEVLVEQLTGKSLSEHMAAFRKIRPRILETYDSYNERILSFKDTLGVSSEETELIYYDSLEGIPLAQAQIRAFR